VDLVVVALAAFATASSAASPTPMQDALRAVKAAGASSVQAAAALSAMMQTNLIDLAPRVGKLHLNAAGEHHLRFHPDLPPVVATRRTPLRPEKLTTSRRHR
jgi:hypothetical protein